MGTKPFDCTNAREPGFDSFSVLRQASKHDEVRGVPSFGLEPARNIGQAQRLIPKLAGLRRLYVDGNEVVSVTIRRAMTRVVEKPDSVGARGLLT